jgi:predicted RNase H-like HicB family nuclease
MIIRVAIHEAEEGGYWAEVPALKGCYSQGETIKEVQNNIKDAIEGWLETKNDMVIGKNESDQIFEVAL